MQFLSIKQKAKSTITFTLPELKRLEETEHSCVEKVIQRLHLTLLPFHLSSIPSSINEILSSNITKYNKDLDGILLGYKNVKVVDSTPAIHNDNCLVHVSVDAEFYLFKPDEGKTLIGVVNQISDDHIGCLVHNAFNVVVPKQQNGSLVKKNQHVLVKVSYINLEAKLPYIKADLISVISDTDSGISTSEENHFDVPFSPSIPEVLIEKKKSPKKATQNVNDEESEATWGIDLVNDENTLKKKKAKKQRHDPQPDEDCNMNYEQTSKILDSDSCSTTLHSYFNELPLQKKKKKKKPKSFECENKEECLPNAFNEIDNYDTFSHNKKAKKKKYRENNEENQDIANENTESLTFIPKMEIKKHKKKKNLIDEPDNYFLKSLEVSEKSSLPFYKEDDNETKQMAGKQEILKDKSLKLKILQDITVKPAQELKHKSIKNKFDNVEKVLENFSEDVTYPKKNRKHKNVKKDNSEIYNENVDEELKQNLLKSAVVNFNQDDFSFVEKKDKSMKSKHKNPDKYLEKSSENTLDLIEDLKRKALEGVLHNTKDLNKTKHKKSNKHDSGEVTDTAVCDLYKTNDNSTLDLIEYLKDKALKSTLEDTAISKKEKKHKKRKQDNSDQDLNQSEDNTLDIIENLKRKALQNALETSKKHIKAKQDAYKITTENMEEMNKKIKHQKLKDTERGNLFGTNDSTNDLIEELKRKAIESTIGKVNKKGKLNRSQNIDEIEVLKRKAVEKISKESSYKEASPAEIVNTKKAKKAKKHSEDMSSTEHINISELEVDNIRHTVLAQALSKITDPHEIKTHKKKKRRHKDELDINELKSQTLQKILGNLKEDEMYSHSTKKKKKKDDIDLDKMKQTAMDKLLGKNIYTDENDSSEEESEQLTRHKKSTKKRQTSLENLVFEHNFSGDQSKHKVKKKKKEKH